MKKRLSQLLAFMLVLCMCISLMPAAFADGDETAADSAQDTSAAEDTYSFAV